MFLVHVSLVTKSSPRGLCARTHTRKTRSRPDGVGSRSQLLIVGRARCGNVCRHIHVCAKSRSRGYDPEFSSDYYDCLGSNAGKQRPENVGAGVVARLLLAVLRGGLCGCVAVLAVSWMIDVYECPGVIFRRCCADQ